MAHFNRNTQSWTLRNDFSNSFDELFEGWEWQGEALSREQMASAVALILDQAFDHVKSLASQNDWDDERLEEALSDLESEREEIIDAAMQLEKEALEMIAFQEIISSGSVEVTYGGGDYRAQVDEDEEGGYIVSYFKAQEMMPAFKSEHYDSEEELVEAMRGINADASAWKPVEFDY